MSEAEDKKAQAEEAPEGGVLLACGATDWYSIGRTKEVNVRAVAIRALQGCRPLRRRSTIGGS